MKAKTFQKIAVGIALFLSLALFAQAKDVQMNIPPGNYQYHLGNGKISDPSGTSHTRNEIAGKVVVAIFSAPNMSQGDVQQKWSDLLATNPKTKVNDKVDLLLVEDMSQAGMFKGIALDDMKKDFTPDSRPFLILDETGNVFKKFGVPRGKTEILIYDKKGTLRDVENDLSDQDTTVHRIKVITAKLLAE
jgi:hypothetical protein